ncbi:MAG: MiaB/RimO family radical SAM methylthiotransferase, partial [Candidatus Omnitrophota bacterium]
AHFAYLKICESCVNNCSFCIIPKIKGRFQSLDIDSVLRKVDGFNKKGISELNIIGQDITGFGMDLYNRPRLSSLLREILNKAPDIGWIRLLYLYPSRISDELLELIRLEAKLCKYIDLPIQHINPRILRLMNRDTKKEEILRLIEKIRRLVPNVALRTSIIAGFPSETDKEFKELLRFLQEVKFERLGAFIYSREENTPAYDFKNQLPEKTKIERFNAIMSLQREISTEVNKRMIGQSIDVLIDQAKKGSYLGRTQYDAPEVDGLVYVRSKQKLEAGDIVKVKINDTLEYDLVGEAIDK